METPANGSPRIISSGWGKIEVESIGKGKDVKLWPGGGKAWDWSEFGTAHSSGIRQGDVEELVEKGCKVVVLTTGRFQRLNVPDRIVNGLKARGIEVVVADTKKGIRLYNEFVDKGMPAGGLFHSTC